MPYATRQGTIDFPKKKSLYVRKSKKLESEAQDSPLSKTAVVTVSSSARKAFHSSSSIVGREKEIKQLTEFLISHSAAQSSGSIYISGLPGTGKTACVNHIIEKNQLSKAYIIIKINCTAFNSSKAVFKRICQELNKKLSPKNEKDAVSFIEKYLLKKHKMILLILDEVDQLESKAQSVLYKIFEWPSWENSKFVLIGIANAMDLPDRHLPRLCAKIETRPMLLHFIPYTKNEIMEILKCRLLDVGADKIFAPGAIELISAKVAGTSGDVRRALDLGRRVIEIAEEKNQTNNSDVSEKPLNSPNKNRMKHNLNKISGESPAKRTPRKLELLVDEMLENVKSPPKRKLNFSLSSPEKKQRNSSEASPSKLSKHNNSERISLSEIQLHESISQKGFHEKKTIRKSPRKHGGLCNIPEEKNVENCRNQKQKPRVEVGVDEKPSRLNPEGGALRRSPRKLQFDVQSKDVLTVVKSVFGNNKNFKPNEESSFPLHQKLLICSLLLMIRKGKNKDLNIGKLHQVYSKVCCKRGLTAVDKSGFIFLCRQVEVTGIIQIGKGPPTLAKVSLQWDESEVTNSLKDLNLLSSILNDASCLT